MRKAFLLSLLFMIVFLSNAKEVIVPYKLSTSNGLPDNDIRSITQDKTGYLYFTSKYAVYKYNGYDFIKLPDSEFHKHESRPMHKGNLHLDNHGNTVTILQDGNIVWQDKRNHEKVVMKVFTPDVKALTTSLRINVLTDKNGRIWVSVYGNGVFIYDRKTRQMRHLSEFDDEKLIDYNYIVCMMEDRDGNIWLSQEHFGVVCLKPVRINYNVVHVAPSHFTYDNIRLLKRLDDNTLIIADNYNAVYRCQSDLSGVTKLDNKGGNFIEACLDKEGRLWLGSRKNGVLIDGKWYSSGRVDCILQDKKGRMWMCNINGDVVCATLSHDGHYQERHLFTDKKDLKPRCFVEDKHGRFWLGTAQGIFIFSPDELVKNAKAYHQINRISVQSLFIDSKERIWIGTPGNGVFYGNISSNGIQHLKHLTTEDGLPNDVIKSIREDSSHRICLATEDGCAYVGSNNPYTLYLTEHPLNNYYNENSGVLLADGRMAFGTFDGIVVVDKQLPLQTTKSKRIYVTDMLINGRSIYQFEDILEKGKDICDVQKISLNHHQNSLLIRFSAFNPASDQKTLYSYRLEGFNKEWSPVSTMNFATFNELPSGEYTLQLRHRENNGEWVNTDHVLRIIVNPPLWLSWWAKLIYVVIIISIVCIILRQIRSTQQLNQRIAIEKEMTAFKLKFFTDISHEFRTPLTLIQTAMVRMKDVSNLPSEVKQPMSNMQRSVERLLRLINQLMEFRKMQDGKLSLKLQETNIVAFLREIWLNFYVTAQNKKMNYSYLPQEKQLMGYIDHGHIDKIVYNLLSNAFKYTPNWGSIIMSMKHKDGIMTITVTDTGVGIDEEKQKTLFQRYATGNLSANSIGIGLNLSYNLALAHHGKLSYIPNPEGGSIFTLMIPVTQEAYSESDFVLGNNNLHEYEELEKAHKEEYRETIPAPMNDKRLLIVDDDSDLQNMLIRELGRYFIIEAASSSEEAWRMLMEKEQKGTSQYDLIISDVMMTGLNGYELLSKLRNHQTLCTIPFILLTALTEDDKHTKGLDMGADAYITKPFSIELLIAQVSNLIKQRDALRLSYAEAPQQKDTLKEIIRSEKDKRFIDLLDTYIYNNIANPNLSVDTLAEMFKVGRTTLSTRVRKLTGKAPAEYIRDIRLHRVAEMLQNDSYNISEATFQVGFKSPQHLSKAFKQKFGISPSEYKKGKEE